MNKTALVPIAEGTEELEAVTIIDVLRRAGIEVTVASANEGENLQITGAQGTAIVADKMLGQCAENSYDLIAVPGGLPGSEHLAEHQALDAMLRAQAEQEPFDRRHLRRPGTGAVQQGPVARQDCHLLSRFSAGTGGKGS